MAGFGVKLPMQTDPVDGFKVTKTTKENIKQSLKMLILTNPGERIMLPDYGAGIRTFLFEQNSLPTIASIMNRIESQIEIYMPYVKLINIVVGDDIEGIDSRDMNLLNLRIIYSVPNIHGAEELNLYLENIGGYYS